MDSSNNKNIIGEINTRGDFIEKSRTAIGGIAESTKYKKVSYEEEYDDNYDDEKKSTMTYRAPKNNYNISFPEKLNTYILIAGIIIVLFTILIIAL